MGKNRAQSVKSMKTVKTVRKHVRLRKTALQNALVSSLKNGSGRSDLKFALAPRAVTKTMRMVPPSERAGYPLKFPKGCVDPKDWHTAAGDRVYVDFNRSPWLPDDWGQGVKCTNFVSKSGSGGGGTKGVFMSPEGLNFWNRLSAQRHTGRTLTKKDGRNGQVRKAQLQAHQHIQAVRAQIKDREFNGTQHIGLDSEASFFKLLSEKERAFLPSMDVFHFCIVSARRATCIEGITDIFAVQAQFSETGVVPTWYVDEVSLKDYRALGLKAVVGGKLTAARNKCLADASRLGKACVQISDDISAWEYRHGKRAGPNTDAAKNAAWSAAKRFIISPVAAARFILAKMRATPGDKKPQLGGVYMLGSCARTFSGDEFAREHFILGDFFVVDKSKVRFDEAMTLKEDYDFSCAHIKEHGSVLRCQRMTIAVKHYTNSGGAVDERDKKGKKERMNIAILNQKWAGCFRPNPKRKDEVIMRWRPNPKR